MISCFLQSPCHRSQIGFSTYSVEKHLWCHSKPNYFQMGMEMVPRSLFHVFLCQGWSLPSTSDPCPSPAEHACAQQELLDRAPVLTSWSHWHRLCWCEWEEMAGSACRSGRQSTPGGNQETSRSLWVILIPGWKLCSKISFWKEPKSGYT